MKVYSSSLFRTKLREALNSAEEGDEVTVLRHDKRFRLTLDVSDPQEHRKALENNVPMADDVVPPRGTCKHGAAKGNCRFGCL